VLRGRESKEGGLITLLIVVVVAAMIVDDVALVHITVRVSKV
jgi:hypothetical protein